MRLLVRLPILVDRHAWMVTLCAWVLKKCSRVPGQPGQQPGSIRLCQASLNSHHPGKLPILFPVPFCRCARPAGRVPQSVESPYRRALLRGPHLRPPDPPRFALPARHQPQQDGQLPDHQVNDAVYGIAQAPETCPAAAACIRCVRPAAEHGYLGHERPLLEGQQQLHERLFAHHWQY